MDTNALLPGAVISQYVKPIDDYNIKLKISKKKVHDNRERTNDNG